MSKLETNSPDTGIGLIPNELNWTFINDATQVGKFWFDTETQTFHFEGDLDSSAQIFVKHVLNILNGE